MIRSKLLDSQAVGSIDINIYTNENEICVKVGSSYPCIFIEEGQ